MYTLYLYRALLGYRAYLNGATRDEKFKYCLSKQLQLLALSECHVQTGYVTPVSICTQYQLKQVICKAFEKRQIFRLARTGFYSAQRFSIGNSTDQCSDMCLKWHHHLLVHWNAFKAFKNRFIWQFSTALIIIPLIINHFFKPSIIQSYNNWMLCVCCTSPYRLIVKGSCCSVDISGLPQPVDTAKGTSHGHGCLYRHMAGWQAIGPRASSDHTSWQLPHSCPLSIWYNVQACWKGSAERLSKVN